MKKGMICFLLLLGTLFSFTSCSRQEVKPEAILHRLDSAAAQIGRSQITDDRELIGERTCDDEYTGDYRAECGGKTGRDVVFGGGSVEARTLHVSGIIRTKFGSAAVRIRQNEQVTEPQLREDGSFAVTLHCSGGGNYIMVDYDDFCGDIVLHAEYVPDASGQEAR